MAVFTAISAAITAISGWTITIGTLGSFAVGNFLLRAAVQLGVSALAKAFAGDGPAAPAFSIQGQVRTGGAVPRSFGVGPYLTAGSLVWHTEWGKVGGTPNAYYTQVIALSDLPVSGLRRWFIENQAVTLAEAEGEFGFAANEFIEDGVEHAWIRFHDGTQKEADPFLTLKVSDTAPRSYSASRIGAGIAYAVVTFRVNREIFTGFPRSKFVLDGIPLYDVSRDSTRGGVGSHRWDDPATWGGDGDALPAVQAYNLARGIYYAPDFGAGGAGEDASVSLDGDLVSLSLKIVGGGGGTREGGAAGAATVVTLKDGASVIQTWTAAGGAAGVASNTAPVGGGAGASALSPRGDGGVGIAHVFEGGSEGAGILEQGYIDGSAGQYLEVFGYDISGLSDPVLEISIGAGGAGDGVAAGRDGYVSYQTDAAADTIAPQWFYGLQGLTAARLPAAHWISQIEKCRSEIEGDDGPEPLFRSAGEIPVDAEIGKAFEAILTACAGRMSEIGGVFKIYVGGPDAPVAHIDDGDIVSTSPQTFTPFFGLSETVNGVVATYPSPDEAYVMRSTPPVFNEGYEVEDGGRRLLSKVALSFVPFPAQAQRLLKGELAAARRARRHTFTLPAKYRLIEPGDVVTWTSARNGYDAKQFRVDGVIDLPNCDLIADLTEVDPADHGSWDHSSDFTPVAADPLPSVRPTAQAVVGFNPVAADILDAEGAARRPGLRMQWDPDVDGVSGIIFEVRLAASGALVATAQTRDFAAGALPIASGLVAANVYEARAKYIPAFPRRVQWTGWLPVVTHDVRFGEADFSDDLWGVLDERAGEAVGALYGNVDYVLDRIAELDLDGRVSAILEDARIDGEVEAQRTELSAEIGAVSANLTQNYVTAATQTAALAQLETSLTTQTNNAISTATSNLVSYTDQSIALSGLYQDLTSDYEGHVATATQNLVTQSDMTGAISAATTSLTTTVNNHTTSIDTITASVDGVMGTYGVRVNNNGVISGFGLVSELIDGAPVSTFTVQANKFVIASFDGTGATSPFTVIDGVTYIKSALIQDASIVSANIGHLEVKTINLDGEAVETGKIANNAATAIRKATGGGGDKQIAITNNTGVTMNLLVLAFFRTQDTATTPSAGCRIYAATSSGGTNGLLATMTETGPDTSPSQNTVVATGTVAGSANISNGSTKYIRAVGFGDNKSQVDLLVFQRQK